MTSEIETLKTNEFQRRRKLRLQQVREQSKDIAKKLRLRAKVEKLRHIVELDEQQENEYLERQERIVKQLEEVYAKGKQNTGASHNQAFLEKTRAEPVVATPAGAASVGCGISKFDIAKIRAREAAAQLRQKKQEALDDKNRLLQRKLKAREAANEISRERTKSASYPKEPLAQGTDCSEKLIQVHNPSEELNGANNEYAEKFIQNTPQSQGVITDCIELQDRPASAIIVEPEASNQPCDPTTSKPETVPSEAEVDVCQPNRTAKRNNFYSIYHSKAKQTAEKEINEKAKESVKSRNEMATKWDSEFLPNEWVPNVPKLKLPDDDKVSTVFIDAGVHKPRQAKTNNLFDLSEDMPSSLRTRRAYTPPSATVQSRSSLTLVSEYLHQRQLRLRDHEASGPSKRRDTAGPAKRHEYKDDLQHCKKTIAWARSSHNEGINYQDVCSVHDEQVIPVPTWQPESSALTSPKVPSTPRAPEPTSPKVNMPLKPKSRAASPKAKSPLSSGKVTSPTTSSIKSKAHGSGLTNIRPLPSNKSSDIITLPPKGVKLMPSVSSNIIVMHPRGIKQPSSNAFSNESSNIIDLPLRPPSPVIRGVSPFRRNKVRPTMFNQAHAENPELKSVPLQIDKAKNERRKRSNITMYNHFTKDKRVVEADESNFVLRDDTPEEDAYFTAMRESEGFKDKPRYEKHKSNRNRIASDKQTVEKEYQDTMAFLNSLAKGQTANHRPIRKAYMDEDRQANVEERHQRKMQHEYRKIEKEAMRKHPSKSPSKDTQGRRGKSPGKACADAHPGDFQYSWMPVPDSDASLFVHTIPTTTNENDKFQKVDCYHEYRSRHKHTPPTKEKRSHNRTQQDDSFTESEYYSSHDSKTSNNDYSIEEDRSSRKKSTNKDSSDAERIIVYKILESKRKKDKCRKKSKFSSDNVRSMTSVRNALCKTKKVVTHPRQGSLEHLNEGVYKNVSPKGQFCNMISSETTNIEFWQATAEPRPWWDNIQSLYFPASHDKIGDPSSNNSHHVQGRDTRQMQWDCGDKALDERSSAPTSKPSHSTSSQLPTQISHVTYTKSSISRGQSVSTEKGTVQTNIETVTTGNAGRQEGGYVKLLGEQGQETEKLILGAAGLLNDDGYEVVIQLRKKETGKNIGESTHQLKENPSQDLEGVDEVTKKLVRTVSSQSSLPYLEPAAEEKVSAPAPDTEEANQTEPKPSEKDEVKSEATKQTVCTQTSLHSPSQRSLMFMSSSTSTAYMSPPETILPPCMKHSSMTTTNKSSDYAKSCSSKNQGLKSSKKHVKCCCRKCAHVELHADASDLGTEETHTRRYNLQVPPNTARSDVVGDGDKKPSRQCTCPKCGNDKVTKAKHKRRRRRYNQGAEKDYAVHKNMFATTKLYKEELNPIIKDYVKRLLTLNKEGLKAIEVLNQECSSVTTPGSSIMNIDSNHEDKRSAEAKLSLEYLKNILLQKIDEESKKSNTKTQPQRKKKTVHKIKSCNISKHLLRKKSDSENADKLLEAAQLPSSTSAKENDSDQARLETMVWNRSPKLTNNIKVLEEKHSETSMSSASAAEVVMKHKKTKAGKHKVHSKRSPSLPLQNLHPSDVSSSIDYKAKSCGYSATALPRQRENHGDTKSNVCETSFISIAETKVQNMERIANLTEKCTQRLSNLAKVLEEVRKNKSSAFSHLSTGESSSESEQKTTLKNVFKSRSQSQLAHNVSENKENLQEFSAKSLPAKSLDSSSEGVKLADISDSTKSFNVDDKVQNPREYPSILEGIPKPSSQLSPLQISPPSEINNNGDCPKRKPPPALTRMKHGPDDIIPHELSTVVEVDSPMSMKFKPHDSAVLENKEPSVHTPKELSVLETPTENLPNPDLVQSNVKLKTKNAKKFDNSKMEMMDLNKFNEIMLKPFVSIEEFAKRCNVHQYEDGSNIGDIAKDTTLNDDLSSMHSEGSLPDVIGELLKRNLITEPFKFDVASNIQSTTISSESSISVLALSKLNNKEKKKPYMSIVNRDIAETSDTLSVSSNPDLENAFKKLGMGWASSTLKKTKERLALSSSSSSSSCSQKHTLKAFEKHESPTKKKESKNSVTVSALKNAEQQTLQLKGVTVQEFLTNELANKITFNNKSQRDETEQEFITLHETRMPEEMKHSIAQEQSADNSGANPNRARTSTPVQLFKSLTYHSSSSSNNISNGLFSNVDDLSSVKVTSSSLRNHSTSDKDDLTVPNISLKLKRNTSDVSKSE